MLGYLETLTLKGENLASEDRQKYLHIVSQHGQRLNRLIDDLFELAKFDAKEISLQKEVFSFSEFIFDVIQKFQHNAEKNDIRLVLKCPQEALLVDADIALIERVLDNLLSNAFSYTKPQDKIIIAVIKQPTEINVLIQDTGCGISQTDLPKIFSRSYQAENKHRKGMHAGLGLAIVKQIVELHQQKIEVSSQIGKGTQFRFSLLLENNG
jgi:signal transduction histidine kinase